MPSDKVDQGSSAVTNVAAETRPGRRGPLDSVSWDADRVTQVTAREHDLVQHRAAIVSSLWS